MCNTLSPKTHQSDIFKKLENIDVNNNIQQDPIKNTKNQIRYNNSDYALVLIYRRELLAKALGCDKACCILKSHGYPLHDVDACLECLKRKFSHSFPHEIGLFLDYPPDDVKGFMEDRGAKNLACSGYWKVYGNPDEARRIFSEYRKAECEAALLIMAERSAKINSGGQS